MTTPNSTGIGGLQVLAFLAELVLWAGCGAAAYLLIGGGVAGVLAAAATVVVVIVGWSAVMAPRASRRLPVAGRAAVVVGLGAASTLLLAAQDAWAWAASCAVAAVLMIVADRGPHGSG